MICCRMSAEFINSIKRDLAIYKLYEASVWLNRINGLMRTIVRLFDLIKTELIRISAVKTG